MLRSLLCQEKSQNTGELREQSGIKTTALSCLLIQLNLHLLLRLLLICSQCVQCITYFEFSSLFYSMKHKEGECTGDLPVMGIPNKLSGDLEIIYSYSVTFAVSLISRERSPNRAKNFFFFPLVHWTSATQILVVRK